MLSELRCGGVLKRGLSFWLLLFSLFVILPKSAAWADDLTFSYGGNANWFTETATSHSGGNAFQSGAISNSQSSWMETTVTGPGVIRFWWKVSSEGCCDPLRFSIDGTAQTDIRGEIDWQYKSFSVPAGTHTLRWTYSTDGSILSGSNSAWLDQITFTPGTFDLTAPTTTASPAGYYYYPAGQSVTLSCSDGTGSGCASTYYCLGSGCSPTSSYTAPIALSSSTPIRFYSTDVAGNSETVQQTSYYIDNQAPTTNANPAAGSYVGGRSIQLSCSDSGMGCASTYYCTGSGCTPTTAYQYSTSIAVNASTVLRYYSTDRAGNTEAVSTANYTITADTTPPTTTPSRVSGTYAAFYPYFTCSDGNGSGCAATYYCLGSGCTPTTLYANQIPYLTNSSDLRFYSTDNSGNSEAVQTVSYVIDKTPPVTSASPSAGTYTEAPVVTLSCSDGSGTGCNQTYYCTGPNCTPNINYSVPIRINDTTVLRFYSSDNAYNNESVNTLNYVRGSQARTINVPADMATIQAAIDAAYNGDTVLVAPGTYLENIDFHGKNITVTSSGGADATIIDGNRNGSVVSLVSGETRASVLDGFSIRNGSASYNGGGIYVGNSSPTITNNKVYGNTGDFGGGIAVYFGSPSIRNNSIYQNSGDWGGGISLTGSTTVAEVTGNSIYQNRASNGGGISLWAAGN
ncbi:chitobiase/beta-hexosaminidase C-terminal domain-containing protein [Geomesophilobacter sediminis]|uniref:Chitobiase/beta-hexosaminidase C-terminal domain-containing protein n=1 Tax=Geomesophilobacter sediminis TaxID=2798584 RepID=A0A8J7LYP3_9BACT|nr:chitobiase/beta-hexosaminidase C-terminal domain-containing protein [Geomesophilobacter sediminis]MBJ6725341.1 chitobiase/beta-hexosaminidase C-terminal domain-containing protein [Geomesophilobacter sediminis]